MWATSIGSTFSHSPLPGVRKSGIPDGTEIPAPVRTTAREDPRTQVREPLDGALVDAQPHYLPWNFGVRLPRKAPMPSLASSEPNTSPNACGLDLQRVGAARRVRPTPA